MMMNNLTLPRVFEDGNRRGLDDEPVLRDDLDELCAAEQAVLARLQIPLGGPRALELGGRFAGSEARLRGCAEGAFDLVLCGRRSLDGLGAEERARALAQLHRALSPGGWLCLASANLRGLPWQTLQRIRDRPLLAWCQETYQMLQRDVRAQLGQPHLIVHEGSEQAIYYIRPEAQVAQLEQAGFEWVDVYQDRLLIPGAAQAALRELRGPRLHYLCRKPVP